MRAIISRRGILALTLVPGLARAQATDPAAPVRALDDGLLAAMKAGRATPFATRASALTPVIAAAFDLRQILQTSIGPRWQAIPPPQQAALLDVFTRYTVASFAGNFDSFAGERFEIVPDIRPAGDDRIVQTRIIPPNGAPTRIDYVMRQTPQGWRAVDVLADGTISRVAVQRSDFRNLVGTDGAALVDSLNAKVTSLSAGAKP